MPLIAGTFTADTDGWIHIAPMGEFPWSKKVDGTLVEIIQVIDNRACQQMLEHFTGNVLLDYDHGSLDPTTSSAAAAWITELQIRNDGIWGKCKPTKEGADAINTGKYRYTSPVWINSDLEHIEGNQYRPIRIDSVGLTNRPNLRGIHPISNRAQELITAPAATPPSPPSQTEESVNMDELRQLLGLPPEATDADILAAVKKLTQKAEDAKAEAQKADANAAMAEAGVPAENREQYRDLFIANRESAIAMFQAGQTAVPNRSNLPLPNRQNNQPAAGDETKADERRAIRIRTRAHAIANSEHIPWGEAWRRAKAEVAE